MAPVICYNSILMRIRISQDLKVLMEGWWKKYGEWQGHPEISSPFIWGILLLEPVEGQKSAPELLHRSAGLCGNVSN